MADADSEALAAPPPFPWKRVLAFSALVAAAYSAALAVVSFGANAALIDSTSLSVPDGPDIRLGLPDELVGFFVGAAVACLIGGLIALFFARRIWRRDRYRLGWGFLIAVPLIVVASAPIGVLSIGGGLLGGEVGRAVTPSSRTVELHNDTSQVVTVRYCVQQQCTNDRGVTIAPGKSHSYPAPDDDATPDEFVISSVGTGKRCDLVPGLAKDETGPIPVEVSEADTEAC